MECENCHVELIEVTTLSDKVKKYLCPKCNKVFTIDFVRQSKDTCEYCGNKFIEDERGNCLSCGAHK